ncbi:Hypothetical protein FKW44_002113 [Caligus rogercresseyi]|uniref:Uncharacterized protein n=1 Tax=Caligus rogercresseyi TaxID=217165 RepID=A0A7T8QW31_CALRO|nr:Hypothetical protein FKW44_002113 [Caligus rogercresseyi]
MPKRTNVTRIIAGTTDEKARCDNLKEREFPTLERAVTVYLASEVASINQATLSDQPSIKSHYTGKA